MSSLITMPEIARLANVTRQAVTNWRSRPASATFPAAVTTLDGVERFDRDEILDWLDATGRGTNREARLDAPGVVAPDDLDLERAVVLLTLRAKGAQDIGPLSPQQRIESARQIDPGDAFLLAEVRRVAHDDAVATYVDGLLEASFGPADALDRLYATRPAGGSRGFTASLIALVASIADAAQTVLGPDGVAIDLRMGPRARGVAAGFSAVARADGADRSMVRHLLLDGLVIDDAEGPRVRVLSAAGRGQREALDLADVTALDLVPGQVAVVVGPSSALCDQLVGDLYVARRKTLELGLLAAACRLPRGLWREAPRQHLGLWVLQGGAPRGGVLVADLSGRAPDPAELAADVLGALQRTGARAYRYGRVVPYRDVWTRDTVVVAGIGSAGPAVTGESPLERALSATLVTGESITGFDLTLVSPSGATRPAPRSLGELVASRAIRVQSGSRVSAEHLDPAGTVRVLAADPSGTQGRIDALTAVDRYPHAARTEPGDVVFVAALAPCALVDEEGGSLVASPSRILRVDPARAGIGPRALAAAITTRATGSEWRTWPIPNVGRAHVRELEDALGGIGEHLAVLRRHERAATDLITNLIQGVAEGSVALGSPRQQKAG